MDEPHLRTARRTLGETLSDRGVSARVAIIGGAALLLAEGLRRPTQDVDVVAVAIGDSAAWVRDRFPGGPHPGLDELLHALERASRG